jgi:four helix bundle suffix protein
LKLTNVARASLEELRLDYEDFLRHRGLPQWGREDPRRADLINRRCHSVDEVAKWIKEVHEKVNNKDQSTGSTKSTYPEITANAALVLIIVACSLLDRQLAAQAEAFEKEGGFTERLYQRRIQARRRQ